MTTPTPLPAVSALSGTTVVVVGGSSGIGKEVARQALAAGAAVTIASRSRDRLDAAAKDLGDVATATVDITDDASVRDLFAGVGAFDHLVVAPGDIAVGSPYDVALDDVRRCLDTKILGHLLCVRHAGPRLARDGSIVLLAGGAGFKAYPQMSVTGAANAGIGALGRTFALELAPIRVNVVIAGLIDTPLWDAFPADAREAM
ncbi:MAG: SDR family NAD(P)-dependent oxidoreductase, partial [Streptomycetaceae bacterium]|nr:SDR family NAD(P)-dependent oxidoreductase [Streptomycetaceae bacterium]